MRLVVDASMALCALVLAVLAMATSCQQPSVVNIGAVLTFDSVIGRAAKLALEAAESDVNAHPRILRGTKLRLIMEDSVCNVFIGSLGGFEVIEKEVVAIIGPLSSSIAHSMSAVANGLRIPLVSFAATDPTLSALQFPYFLRTTPNDTHQMAAMADLIDFYGWKEVISVYSDDELGRNGISALDNELYKRSLRLSYKFPLPVQFDERFVIDALSRSNSLGPRVYVLHFGPDPTLRIFSVIRKLQMMNRDYVWLATDWLSVTLDYLYSSGKSFPNDVEGVLGLRQHIPESIKKREFMQKLQGNVSEHLEMNAYALRAYDTVWTIAYAIDKLLNDGINLTFSYSKKLLGARTTKLRLEKIKIFDSGELLLKKLLQVNFTGIAGPVQFDSDRNVINGDYEIINVNQTGINTIGFWSKNVGFSVVPPETRQEANNNNLVSADQKLRDVTWPGETRIKPRGWVIADSGRPLRIAVPRRVSFVEFVTEQKSRSHHIQGYCIDVFYEALKLVPYYVSYRFEPFGDGHSNPNYNQMVKMVTDDVYDAAVGDIAIVTSRTKVVDFSQPYASTGLVVVILAQSKGSDTWIFLKPFTIRLWTVVVASFVVIGIVIWILEHRINDDFRGPPKKQITTIFLFSFSTLFKRNQEDTIGNLARLVMIVWLFLLMIITASYTANLTSILTVQRLPSAITGIESLLSSNLPVGYQAGTFTHDYLTKSLGMSRSRLVSLGSPEDYERALRLGPRMSGGVAAIVDELPYVELFLAGRTDFQIAGQPFTRRGWGFAFKRESLLALDISTALLKLSETGKLQEIRTRWFCKSIDCRWKRDWNSEPNHLHLRSFKGLYLVCSAITLLALSVFILRIIAQFVRYKRTEMKNSSSRPSSSSATSPPNRVVELIFSFFEFVDEKEEAIKKMFRRSDNNVQAEATLETRNV